MALGSQDLVFCTPPVAHHDLLQMLEPVRAAGFTGISITPTMVFPLQAQGFTPQQIGRRIVEAGLQVAEVDCIGCWLPGQQPGPHMDPALAELLMGLTPERMLEMAAALGARSVTAVEIFGVPVDVDEAAGAFAAICDKAATDGLLVHIEFIRTGGIPDLRTASEIVRRADRPNGGLTIDALHLARGGTAPADLAETPASRIVTVQLCDAPRRASADPFSEITQGRLLPGEGELDNVELVRTLDRMGATAPLGVEVFSPEAERLPVREIAATWMAATRKVLQAARPPGQDHKDLR